MFIMASRLRGVAGPTVAQWRSMYTRVKEQPDGNAREVRAALEPCGATPSRA